MYIKELLQKLKKIFAKNLVSVRKKRGFDSQRSLAEKSGVTRDMIAKLEAGSSLPSVVNIYRLAKALDVSIDDLLRDDES